jgi:hypothetical protein
MGPKMLMKHVQFVVQIILSLLVLETAVYALQMPSSASPHTSSYGSPGSTSPTHFHSDPSFLYPHEPGGKIGRQRLSSYYSSELMNTLPEKVKSPKTTKQILTNIHLELTASEVPLDVKELYESFEFFLRTRKRLFGAAKRGPSPPLPIEVRLRRSSLLSLLLPP